MVYGRQCGGLSAAAFREMTVSYLANSRIKYASCLGSVLFHSSLLSPSPGRSLDMTEILLTGTKTIIHTTEVCIII